MYNALDFQTIYAKRLELDTQQKDPTFKKLHREDELLAGYNGRWLKKLSKSEKKLEPYDRVRKYCIDEVRGGCSWAEANLLLVHSLKSDEEYERDSLKRSKKQSSSNIDDKTAQYHHLLKTWMLPTNVISQSVPKSLNSECKRLKRFPTALEFMRDYISKSVPFIVEGGVNSWPAVGKWSMKHLNETVGEKPVKIYTSLDRDFEKVQQFGEWRNKSLSRLSAEPTPSGTVEDSEFIMIRPAETQFTFAQYMYLATHYPNLEGATFYLQKHDMRRWKDMGSIVKDISPSIFGSKAAPADKQSKEKSKKKSSKSKSSGEVEPDYWQNNGFGFAHFLPLEHFFMWAGTTDTRGPVHYDENENIFSMVRGTKTFELFHPMESETMYETMAKFRSGHLLFDIDLGEDNEHYQETKGMAQRRREAERERGDGEPLSVTEGQFYSVPVASTEASYQPFSPVNISHPDYNLHPNFRRARKVTCTVNTGDVLYLPSNWWHEVTTHPPGAEGSALGRKGRGGSSKKRKQEATEEELDEDGMPMTIGINIFFRPYWKKGSDFKHYSRTHYYDHFNRYLEVDADIARLMLAKGSTDQSLDHRKAFILNEKKLKAALKEDYWRKGAKKAVGGKKSTGTRKSGTKPTGTRRSDDAGDRKPPKKPTSSKGKKKSKLKKQATKKAKTRG